MKKTITIFSMILCLMIGSQGSHAQSSQFDKWPELKTFHGVMAQTYHPSEEGNLKPIKERVGEMVEKAAALEKSKIPAELDKKGVREAVTKLAADSKSLQELIRKGRSDAEIKKALSSLHDTFHLIVERCEKGEGHPDK